MSEATKIVPATSDLAALYVKPKERSPIVIASQLPSITHWGAIRTPSQGPSTAKEARFTCDSCKTSTIVYGCNAPAWVRQKKMKEAVDLHRLVCTVGLPEDTRIYHIHYPRG